MLLIVKSRIVVEIAVVYFQLM